MKVVIASAVAAVAMLTSPVAAAQRQAYSFPDVTTLVGPGSAIGVRVRELTAAEANAPATVAGGVFVEEVVPNTPAEGAGLKRGDIVVEFDGERVRSVRGFMRLVSETPPQRTVKAVIVRGGARQTLDVTPSGANQVNGVRRQTFPNLPLLRERGVAPVPPRLGIPQYRGWIGVTVETVRGQMADYFGVKAGALVSGVDLDSPASKAGLRAGDVIVAAGGRPIADAADVTVAVRRATPGEPLELMVVRDRKEMKLTVDVPTGQRMLL